MVVKYDGRYLQGFLREEEFGRLWPATQQACDMLYDHSGPGSDFLGWVDLPVAYDRTEFAAIKAAAAQIRADSDVLVVIGIGGSYLGARAVIEAVRGASYNLLCTDTPRILFTGNSISPAALRDVLALCEGRRVSVNVISKSGTTTEPAIAFRVMKQYMEQRYGREEARRRIYATTDARRGTLKALADAEGYTTFVVPDDVGGRYSVLTAVGLLPIACAGIDIDALMAGAADARTTASARKPDTACCRYAMARTLLYRRGKSVETLVCYEPAFAMMNEWFKQLYGESEGKDGKGLMPTSVICSTDLHSMGQYLQDGARILFETVVDVAAPAAELEVPAGGNDDGLGYLAGRPMSAINRQAMLGTVLAHTDGGVPNILLHLPGLTAYDVGDLIYFFESACAISGYLLGVNPFDQPGVESYKQNMFALLGKPGFEQAAARLRERLG